MPTYEIKSTEYGDSVVRTDEDGSVWFIPIDPANSDYQRYLNPEAATPPTIGE